MYHLCNYSEFLFFPGVVCKEQDELEAIVLFVDVEADCVQLSLNKELVNAVKKFVDTKYSKVMETVEIRHLVPFSFLKP